MLQVHKLAFNPFQENTYIISNNTAQCWIVDPGMSTNAEQQDMLAYIGSKQLQPVAIINTHAHIDHILGVDFIAQHFNIPFFIHEKELPILQNAANTAKMFGFQYEGVQTQVQYLSEQKNYQLGTEYIDILLVPGHSPGSIAFYSEKDNWVISGDALFAGGIGRTDLLMGDYDTLIQSIKNELLTLPDDTIVYSGHGGTTTISSERKNNPFLR